MDFGRGDLYFVSGNELLVCFDFRAHSFQIIPPESIRENWSTAANTMKYVRLEAISRQRIGE